MKKNYALIFYINFQLHKIFGKRFDLLSRKSKKNLFFKVFSAGYYLNALLFLLTNCFCSAQGDNKAGQLLWTVRNPFEHSVFIKNNGQFEGVEREVKNKIYYAYFSNGVETYFTGEGIIFRRREVKKGDHDFIFEAGEEEEKEEGEKKAEYDSHILQMKWENTVKRPELIAEDSVSYYFTYPALTPGSAGGGIKAAAYKKIIYKNVYPLIDVEYYFSQEASGIKYAFHLHPGADASRIKMNYSISGINVLTNGNLEIPSSFGVIRDKAPQTFYAGSNTKIASEFKVQKNTVSFLLEDYNHSLEVIIDPFLTAPVFSGYNGAYDVDYDNAGNVYIYGGGNGFQELKYNSAGILQWVFTACTLDPYYYGDFALDRGTGTSYLSTGVDFYTAAMIKINAAGIFQADLGPNSKLHELWRLVYNNCTKQLIVGGGGWGNTFQSAFVDTNLTTITPVNVLSANNDYHDIAMIAVDNLNNCFMATAKGNPGFDNMILRTPSTALNPLLFIVPDQMLFEEQFSFDYICGKGNGFGGIAVSDKYLYLYNSSTIQRRNKATGALINSSTLANGNYGWNGQIIIDYGGLAVDNCENIYVGKKSSILKCDTNFNVLASIPAADSVYDIRISEGNFLYACGNAFVSAYKLTGAVCNDLNISVATVPCSITGSALATASGGTGTYTFFWTPGNQTGPSVSGLTPGEHMVTVNDASCNPKVATATVNINEIPIAFISGADSLCQGESTTLTASGIGSISWSNGASGSTTVVSPVVSESYSVIITNDDGCSDTAVKFISVNSIPSVVVTGDDTICSGEAAHLLAAGAGNLSWNTGEHTPAIDVFPATSTTYSVTLTNASGCSANAFANVMVKPSPVVNIDGVDTLCAGSSAQLTAEGVGIFEWNTGESTSSITVSPLFTTAFSVIVKNTWGCSDSSIKKIIVRAVPDAAINSVDTICSGERILLSATGGEKYSWNFGKTDSAVTIAPLFTQYYTVIVTNGPCADSAVKRIVVLPVPHATVSVVAIDEFTNQLVAGGIGTCHWFEGEGLGCSDCVSQIIAPVQSTKYCVAVSNAAGCSDTACASITVSSVFVPAAFTPDENNLNDVFKPVVSDISEYSFAVFNRWGEKIFDTDNIENGWNGYYNGSPCMEDVYVYRLSYRDNEEKKRHEQLGKVTLIR